MFSNLCPTCRRVNTAHAQRCRDCYTDLGEWDTQASPLDPLANGQGVGPLWFDDLGEPPRAARAANEAEAASSAITLREIELAPATVAVAEPPAEELVVSDPEVRAPFILEAPLGDTIEMPAVADAAAAARAARKAANRAKVRRARLRDSAVANATAPTAPEVLVADADDNAREQLCSLLRAFGFGVRSAVNSAEAAALAAASPFVAAFVEVALATTDGGDGIDLCKQVREVSPRGEGGAPVLALVAAQLQPMDRVRAKLAGCDEVILKPVTRGSVARLLDARGVALPSDARRI